MVLLRKLHHTLGCKLLSSSDPRQPTLMIFDPAPCVEFYVTFPGTCMASFLIYFLIPDILFDLQSIVWQSSRCSIYLKLAIGSGPVRFQAELELAKIFWRKTRRRTRQEDEEDEDEDEDEEEWHLPALKSRDPHLAGEWKLCVPKRLSLKLFDSTDFWF